eukprot:CAMPEP_0203761590 /NCGR_PEP_ID=MMETSP0098-20131031/14642_1 /ASSEMBLY_ACC=CAM_ASM_000208 /TAXON_ID=96639 /ORGANISM=" , Strain NY0313808BC1" /LENGTH=259 /DNA_ID=CAMNT_0050655643 /DNA_START=23 /DNA_END=799 /DNA_ORIENTATION=+
MKIQSPMLVLWATLSQGSQAKSLRSSAQLDSLYWVPSNSAPEFNWTLDSYVTTSVGSFVAMVTNSNPDCSAWGGMATPGVAAKSMYDKMILANGKPNQFKLFMRPRDGEAPTQQAIDTFYKCVLQDFPQAPAPEGVLCIRDSGSTNTCTSLPPKNYTYGLMAGPNVMKSMPFTQDKSIAAQLRFGELYEPSLVGKSCSITWTGSQYASAAKAYLSKHGPYNSTSMVPSFGGSGANCPMAYSALPGLISGMAGYSRLALW